MSSNASETYARLLLHHGHGYPLWVPEPNDALPQDYRVEGIRVGDVGLVTAGGSFDFLFNVFHSAESPINRCQPGGVPHGFVPLPWDSRFLQINSNQHRPGVPIFSRGTQSLELVAAASTMIPGTPLTVGGGIELKFSDSRGAALMLPNGASRTDYGNLKILREYSANNAESWYRFVNSSAVGREAENGSLYLVTGYDKTGPWEVAAYSHPSRGQTLSIEFCAPMGDGKLRLTRSSMMQSFLSSRISSESCTNNQSVFIRGFKISLKPARWKGLFGSVKSTVKITPITIGRAPKDTLSRGNIYSPPPAISFGSDSYGGTQDDTDPFEVHSPSLSESSSSSVSSDEVLNAQMYHPSTVINNYLLEKVQSANVAITHDNDWSFILNKLDHEILDDAELIQRVEEKFSICVDDLLDCVFLEPRPDLPVNANDFEGEDVPLTASYHDQRLEIPGIPGLDDLGQYGPSSQSHFDSDLHHWIFSEAYTTKWNFAKPDAHLKQQPYQAYYEGNYFSAPQTHFSLPNDTNSYTNDKKTIDETAKQKACIPCQKRKIFCEFRTDSDQCERCRRGDFECVIPEPKQPRTHSEPEHLNEIQAKITQEGKLLQLGACSRCKNLKVRCELKEDTYPCKRCLLGGHECVIPGRKKHRAAPPPPTSTKQLLNEIQRQAEEIQGLIVRLVEIDEDTKRKNAVQSTGASSSVSSPTMASSPTLSPSSTFFSWDFTSETQLNPGTKKDVEDWVAAQESLMKFGGFIAVGGANMPKSYLFEKDLEVTGTRDGNDLDNQDSRIDEEFEPPILGETWDLRDVKGKQAASKRPSSSSERSFGLKQHTTKMSVAGPNEAVPFGLIAELAHKKQMKRPGGSSSEAGDPEIGVANANFHWQRSGPGLYHTKALATNSPEVPHILARGIINPNDAEKLFKIFFDLINPYMSVVDPILYTAQKTAHRSPFLFTTICAISSRFYVEKPWLYAQAMDEAQLVAGITLIDGLKNVEMCIAYILLSLYPPPLKRWEESRSWLYLGVAIRVATELNLHLPILAKPLNEMHVREQLNRTRVWLNCFNLEYSMGSQHGKPLIISNDDFITSHSEDWWESSLYNMENFDIQLCCYNSLLRVMANFRSNIYNNPAHPTAMNKISAETDKEILALQSQWHPILDNNVDKNDIPSNFRLGLLKLAFGHARLIVLSYGVQHAFERNTLSDNPLLERCLNVANDIIQTMVEDIGRPEQRIFIRHGPEAQSVFVTFAAAFLVKLLQPKFEAYIDASKRAAIRSRVQNVIDFFSNPEIAIDDRHGPKLSARFLKGLLASPMVTEANPPGYNQSSRRKSNRMEAVSDQESSDSSGIEFTETSEHSYPATTSRSLSPPPSQATTSFDQFTPPGSAIDPFAPDMGFSYDPTMMDYLNGSLTDGDKLMRLTDPSMWQDLSVPNYSRLAQFQNEVQRVAPDSIYPQYAKG